MKLPTVLYRKNETNNIQTKGKSTVPYEGNLSTCSHHKKFSKGKTTDNIGKTLRILAQEAKYKGNL